MMPPLELLDFLRKEDGFLITTHINPDGDGLGSAIALSMSLQEFGKKTVLLCKDPVPHQYRFLPGHEGFHTFDNAKDFENIILVDCNDIDRIIDRRQNTEDRTQKTEQNSLFSVLCSLFSVVIDHHETEKEFGNIRWVETDSAATGLMIYHLIKELGIKITEDMAVNLYAAIAVDTGNFRYENTTSGVLRAASDLIEAGAKPHVIYRWLFEAWSEGRFDLFMRVLNTLEREDGTAIVKVTRRMFEETSTSPDDTEHFVEFPRIMEDVKVSVLFREIDDTHYKISLRSKDDINVAHVAEAFGGGGHKNAAGCRIKADFETAKKEILNKLKYAVGSMQ
jgi:phosphoesterase RecJ-like protein